MPEADKEGERYQIDKPAGGAGIFPEGLPPARNWG